MIKVRKYNTSVVINPSPTIPYLPPPLYVHTHVYERCTSSSLTAQSSCARRTVVTGEDVNQSFTYLSHVVLCTVVCGLKQYYSNLTSHCVVYRLVIGILYLYTLLYFDLYYTKYII